MSSSPASKRNLKPLPITPATSQPIAPATDSTNVHPLAPSSGMLSLGAYAIQSSPTSPTNSRKRRASGEQMATNPVLAPVTAPSAPPTQASSSFADPNAAARSVDHGAPSQPPAKKGRTNTPWSPAEEQRLKQMRDAGNSWSEIAKTFPSRTEGSVKKHWYKDMHYAEFAEDESAALLAAIKEYEASKWKVIGQKVGKPAKACEQYAKENFGGKM